jgi:DivIVA domain-containing protein
MDISPQSVRNASFRVVKKGYDPDEVKAFLARAAEAIESAQNNSTAMEARARAAVARLQEMSQAGDAAKGIPTDEAETISRTLLLAQRTADNTVTEAKAEAERLVSAARLEAASTLDSTREMSARMLEEAREEARRVGEGERKNLEAEVQALLARRDFLEGDVDHLEQFLVEQRARLRDAAAAMVSLADRVPAGLGEVRRPLLSAAGDDEAPGAGAEVTGDPDSVEEVDEDATMAFAFDAESGPDTAEVPVVGGGDDDTQ